jgi:hypothetical protein
MGSQVVTRGEPPRRPVHITLIACRVYNSVLVIRRITPGLSPGYETRQAAESTFFRLAGPGAESVVRFSRPRSTVLRPHYVAFDDNVHWSSFRLLAQVEGPGSC